MSNGDYDPTLYPQPDPRTPFGNVRAGLGGMFGNLQRGANALNPYSNRLLAFSSGMLSGGPAGAARGMIAGSALDREASDRRKQDAALQGLMGQEGGMLSQFSEPERAYLAANPDALNAVIGSRLKGGGTEWRRLSDNTLFNERTGETRAAGGGAGGGGSFLTGNALETQALRHLVETEQMTEDQAAQWAAGKTITGPNGEILFISPDQLLDAAGMKGGQAGAGDGRRGPLQITGGKPTEDQKKAKGFYDRTLAADAILSDPKISSAGQGSFDKTVSGLPGSQYITSTEFQQFSQAQRDFINATLRRESGAAISESEFENARQQYFPQPGEPKEVVEQKAAARRRVIQSLKESWEPASISPDGEDADPLGLGM